MTYCVGLLVDTGLVMLSDSRTNAGVDQINTFRKMATFTQSDDRVLVLMSAGNLAITQAVVNLLQELPENSDAPARIYRVSNMFNAARVVGDALREIHQRDAKHLEEQGHEFNGTFILGGQIKGEEPRLFHIYSAGNFIESSVDTPYFQIAHHRSGNHAQQQPGAGRQMRAHLHGLDHAFESLGGTALGSRHHPPRRDQAGDAHEHRFRERILQDDSLALGIRVARDLQPVAEPQLVNGGGLRARYWRGDAPWRGAANLS
jgi:hypothetical protein